MDIEFLVKLKKSLVIAEDELSQLLDNSDAKERSQIETKQSSVIIRAKAYIIALEDALGVDLTKIS